MKMKEIEKEIKRLTKLADQVVDQMATCPVSEYGCLRNLRNGYLVKIETLTERSKGTKSGKYDCDISICTGMSIAFKR